MYKPLQIDFKIPKDLQDIIDQYITFLNSGKHGLLDGEDYYYMEIKLTLNWCYRDHLLSEDQIALLRDYYQYGGIKEHGQNL